MDKKKKKESKEEIVDENSQKVENLEDQLKRSVADFQNLEKRMAEEKKQWIKLANYDLLMQLLPAFDALFLAEKYIQDDGLKFTVQSIKSSFENIGVKKIESEGKKFDPNVMEAVETVDGADGMVVEEVRPGFTLFDRVLRPSVVKVGKKLN